MNPTIAINNLHTSIIGPVYQFISYISIISHSYINHIGASYLSNRQKGGAHALRHAII